MQILLSHLPLPETVSKVTVPADIKLLMESLQDSPINANKIRRWTDWDPLMSRVRQLLTQGWQWSNNADLAPFQRRKDELSTQDGCVLWGCDTPTGAETGPGGATSGSPRCFTN
jgi:hypothetical protein